MENQEQVVEIVELTVEELEERINNKKMSEEAAEKVKQEFKKTPDNSKFGLDIRSNPQTGYLYYPVLVKPALA